MTLVELGALGSDAREQLARITLVSAREHAPEWLSDLEAAREQIAEALASGKVARVLLETSGPHRRHRREGVDEQEC